MRRIAGKYQPVVKKYTDKGFHFAMKGFPDFCFTHHGTGETVFVKVVKKHPDGNARSLSPSQRRMKEILEKLGARYEVEYVTVNQTFQAT